MESIFTLLSTGNWFSGGSDKKLENPVIKIIDEQGHLDTEKLDRGILELRNTPNEGGISPSQMVLAKKQDPLYIIYTRNGRKNGKNYYTVQFKNLKDLKMNDKVRIQN